MEIFKQDLEQDPDMRKEILLFKSSFELRRLQLIWPTFFSTHLHPLGLRTPGVMLGTACLALRSFSAPSHEQATLGFWQMTPDILVLDNTIFYSLCIALLQRAGSQIHTVDY